MKYARTKDGKIVKVNLEGDVFTSKYEIVGEPKDTIEELCDYIFYIENKNQKVFKFPEECNFEFIKDLFSKGLVKDLKFGILTNKGIKIIAFMNNEGELELI